MYSEWKRDSELGPNTRRALTYSRLLFRRFKFSKNSSWKHIREAEGGLRGFANIDAEMGESDVQGTRARAARKAADRAAAVRG